jgi:hypothetical protein
VNPYTYDPYGIRTSTEGVTNPFNNPVNFVDPTGAFHWGSFFGWVTFGIAASVTCGALGLAAAPTVVGEAAIVAVCGQVFGIITAYAAATS